MYLIPKKSLASFALIRLNLISLDINQYILSNKNNINKKISMKNSNIFFNMKMNKNNNFNSMCNYYKIDTNVEEYNINKMIMENIEVYDFNKDIMYNYKLIIDNNTKISMVFTSDNISIVDFSKYYDIETRNILNNLK